VYVCMLPLLAREELSGSLHIRYTCSSSSNIPRSVLGEYQHSSSKNKDPSDRPQNQNGDFPEKTAVATDKISVIYGDQFPK
jgi:hypothetical protein